MVKEITISSIYSRGRVLQTLNGSSPQINCVKEQLVTLELQVRDKDRYIKHLRYLIRCAKRSCKYGTVRELESQLIVQKHQLKVLKNRRNHLFNLLTDRRANASRRRAPVICEKTARLRALRLQHEASQTT